MDDLRRRFAGLDRLPAPDLWETIERRAAPAGSLSPVSAVVTPLPLRPRRSLVLLLATVAVLVALVAGAVAIGSRRPVLPAFVTVPSASASVPSASPATEASPSASIATTPWLTGQELMDTLSAEYGHRWSPLVDASTGQAFRSGPIRVNAPVDGRAAVYVSGAVGAAAEVEQDAGRVAQALAPDGAAWIEDAIAQGLDAYTQGLDEADPLVTEYPTSRYRVSTTLTTGGGQVGVTFIDEGLMEDWMSVEFAPDPPPTRTLEPGGSGIVLYPVHRGEDPSGDRIWAMNPDGTDAGLFIPSPRTPYGVGDVLGWSADGSRLFYGAGGGVFAVDADGSKASRVGPRRDNPLCPVVVADDECQPNDDISISPDGTRLAYSLQEGSGLYHSIAILDVASGQVTRLDSTRAQGVDDPSWSPDSTRLVYGCPGIGPRADGICRVNVDGSDLRTILPTMAGDISDLQWSPDGSSILFKVDGDGRAELFTIAPDGAGLRSLTSDGLPDFAHWTRDGRIVSIRWERGPAGGPTDRGDLRIMDADGGNATTLDTSVAAQTAAGCVVCPYLDEQGQVRHRLWQPMPEGQP